MRNPGGLQNYGVQYSRGGVCLNPCSLDRCIRNIFWNFQKCQADLCYILINKQMLEKVFCLNIAP